MKLFNPFGNKEPIPKWASFFNEKEYAAFIKALDSYIKKNT